MTEILLIDVNYLKKNTVINENTDNKILIPFIITSQDKYIEPLTGTKLYTKIKNDVSGNTISGIYNTIWDTHIKRTVKEWTLYECLPFINYKLTNKSVVKKDGENSESAELSEIRFLRGGIRDTAEYYSQRLIQYLKENQSSISEYPGQDSGVDKLHPQNSNYFSGLYLGGGSGISDCNCNYGIGIPLR